MCELSEMKSRGDTFYARLYETTVRRRGNGFSCIVSGGDEFKVMRGVGSGKRSVPVLEAGTHTYLRVEVVFHMIVF